jgi:hypothetical protein
MRELGEFPTLELEKSFHRSMLLDKADGFMA